MASKSQDEKNAPSIAPDERSGSLDIVELKGAGIGTKDASLHRQSSLDGLPNGDDIDSNPHISFRRVEEVNVSVRNLAISFTQRSNLSLPWRRNQEEGKQVIKILENVSTDIPAGQLMAIIGSSGSGKVYDLVSDLLKALIADMFADIHVECYGPPHARSES